VDRPASVVRELIDNSIDADADRIFVRIEMGGKGLIKVNDNGVGMSRDDILLCVERYATSKIETASDLFSVKSFGFRGEALPSIISVSRTEIVSRPKDHLAGHKLKVAGGRLISIEETGAPAGTIIEVRNLFYNIPARRKFLRAARTETDHIIDVFSRIALPFPRIAFRLEDAGKTIMDLPASDKHFHRLNSLLGRKVAEAMIKVKERDNVLGISAYLGSPDLSRTRGDRLFFYVNGRNIRDRLLTKALLEGYGQRLMKGQYPQAVIFIETDPLNVDVNIHPTKQEVRFHNGRDVFQSIVSTVGKALGQSFHPYRGPKPQQGAQFFQEEAPNISESVWTYSQREQSPVVPVEVEERDQPLIGERPQIIGQLGNTYILCQVKDGLLMVDQHAAHERIVYENLKKGANKSRVEAQTLLIPLRLELSAKEQRIVQKKRDQLNRFGIELDPFGGNTFLLRSVPVILRNVQWDAFFSELLAELDDDKLDEDVVLDKALTVMACHGAIRAGHSMNHEEISHLLSELEDMEIPTNCPHGRPIFKRFSYYEIEKMFKRVV